MEWGLSERFFGMVLTREADPARLTPAFEKQRALEKTRIGSEVCAWEEHESPAALVASILGDRKAAPALRIESGTPVTAGCRMIKDAYELALMRRACSRSRWPRTGRCSRRSRRG